ncbi:putative Monooxygenase [Seiridium unicorne]|uniref:Monooxygenase n=1 Tax=Seiridium unicorne TaxID=138068 RepID=A0ABR2V117_9PEZI
MSSRKPHVLIVGAGLGGLALAQGLRKHGVSYAIFERDESLHSRQQGWAIGLHTVLGELQPGLPDDLPPIEPAVNHLKPLKLPPQFIWHVSGNRLGVTGGPDTFVLRANRMRLREWLATKIPITYGKQALKVEENDDSVTVHFQDGTVASGDILVGADGINSRVREHLLSRPNEHTLRTNAFAVIVGETTLTGDAFERQISLGHSAYVGIAGDRARSIFVGLNKVSEDGKVGSYYWFYMISDETIDKPDHWTRHASRAERLEKALQDSKALDEKFREIIKLTPVEGIRSDSFSFRDAEIGKDEYAVRRVTMLGDASHPMAPFRGEGGVHALRDALSLAKTVAKIGNDERKTILNAVGDYQREMVKRGVEAVQRSRAVARKERREDEPFIIWGYPAKPTMEETIKLEDWQ